jgi:predicted Zn-dependent protease
MTRLGMILGLLLAAGCGNGYADRVAAARALLAEGKQAEAREAATALSRDLPRSLEGRLPLARLLIDTGNARRAVVILKDERLTPEARDLLALAYLRTPDLVRAKREVDAQMAAGTESALTLRMWAELLLMERRPREAERVLSKSLKRNADDPMTYVVLAGAHGQQGETAEMVSVLREAHRRFPGDPTVSGSLAESIVGAGRADVTAHREAIGLFRAAARGLPLEDGYRQGLAQTLYVVGEFKEAERELVGFVRDWPENAGMWNLLGLTRLHLGEVEKAIEAFERSVSVGSLPAQKRLECFLNLGNAQLRMADVSEDRERWGQAGWKTFQAAQKMSPKDARVWVGLGKSTVEMDPTGEKIRAAILYYQKALEFDPANFEAHLNIALLYYELWVRKVTDESEGKRRALYHFVEAEKQAPRAKWHVGARRALEELEKK